MASNSSITIHPPSNGAPPRCADIEHQLLENDERWTCLAAARICYPERDRLLAILEAAPITTMADAVATLRAAIFVAHRDCEEQDSLYQDPEEAAGVVC